MNQLAFKRLFLFLAILLLGITTNVQAQDADNNHFIYIQAKAKQPFYVILNKKVYSSSSIGYLIIPKLKDGSYDIRIGFPKEQAPEQNFNCVVKGGDAGYSLEKGDNGNLGLLNLQTKDFIASTSQTTLEDQYAVASPKQEEAEKPKEVPKDTAVTPKASTSTAFGDMLSSAVNDPSLNVSIEQPKAVLPQKEEKISTQVSDFGANPEADSKAIVAASNENLKPAEEVTSDLSKTYGVIKSNQDRSSAGTEMTFIMFNSRSTDTVKIVVPKNKALADAAESEGVAPEKISKKESLALFSNTEEDSFNVERPTVSDRKRAREQRREEKRFVNISPDGAGTGKSEVSVSPGSVDNPFYDKSKDTQEQKSEDVDTEASSVRQKENKVDAVSSDATAVANCDNPLSEKDFSKMQKKMIARNNDNDMIAIADKYIKGKCITTAQVKTLGGLFLSDAGRYALYNDAYPNVSDKQNFSSLENQLLDSYFKKRFQQILQ